eukprot:g2353.t1
MPKKRKSSPTRRNRDRNIQRQKVDRRLKGDSVTIKSEEESSTDLSTEKDSHGVSGEEWKPLKYGYQPGDLRKRYKAFLREGGTWTMPKPRYPPGYVKPKRFPHDPSKRNHGPPGSDPSLPEGVWNIKNPFAYERYLKHNGLEPYKWAFWSWKHHMKNPDDINYLDLRRRQDQAYAKTVIQKAEKLTQTLAPSNASVSPRPSTTSNSMNTTSEHLQEMRSNQTPNMLDDIPGGMVGSTVTNSSSIPIMNTAQYKHFTPGVVQQQSMQQPSLGEHVREHGNYTSSNVELSKKQLLKNYTQAIKWITEALKLVPGYSVAYRLMGLAHFYRANRIWQDFNDDDEPVVSSPDEMTKQLNQLTEAKRLAKLAIDCLNRARNWEPDIDDEEDEDQSSSSSHHGAGGQGAHPQGGREGIPGGANNPAGQQSGAVAPVEDRDEMKLLQEQHEKMLANLTESQRKRYDVEIRELNRDLKYPEITKRVDDAADLQESIDDQIAILKKTIENHQRQAWEHYRNWQLQTQQQHMPLPPLQHSGHHTGPPSGHAQQPPPPPPGAPHNSTTQSSYPHTAGAPPAIPQPPPPGSLAAYQNFVPSSHGPPTVQTLPPAHDPTTQYQLPNRPLTSFAASSFSEATSTTFPKNINFEKQKTTVVNSSTYYEDEREDGRNKDRDRLITVESIRQDANQEAVHGAVHVVNRVIDHIAVRVAVRAAVPAVEAEVQRTKITTVRHMIQDVRTVSNIVESQSQY